MSKRKIPELNATHAHNITSNAKWCECQPYECNNEFSLRSNNLIDDIEVMGQPLRVANLLLDEILEEIPREHKGAKAAEDGACENDGYSEEESVKF